MLTTVVKNSDAPGGTPAKNLAAAPPQVSPCGEYVVTVTYRYRESVPPLRTRATAAPTEQTGSTVRLIPRYRLQDLPLVCALQFPPRGLLKRERQPLPVVEYRWLPVTGTLWTRYRLDQIQAGEPLTLPLLPPSTMVQEEVFSSQREAEAAITQAAGADTLLLLGDEVWQATVEPLYFIQDDQRLFGDAVQLSLVEHCEAGSAAQYFRLNEQQDAFAMRDGLRRYRREKKRKRFREEDEREESHLGFEIRLERPDLLCREPRHELPDHFHPWYAHLRQRLRSLPAMASQAERVDAVASQARAKDFGPVYATERRLPYIKPDHAFLTGDEPLYSEAERAGLIGFLLAVGPYPAAAYTGLCDADLARAYASAIRFIS